MMGFGFLGLLLMLFFWIGLIALAIWAVKGLFPSSKSSESFHTDPSGQGPSARQILDQRYARGEISREQYELMKRDLEG